MIASRVEGATLGAQACSHGSKLLTFAGCRGAGSPTVASIGGTAVLGRMGAATFVLSREIEAGGSVILSTGGPWPPIPGGANIVSRVSVRFAAGANGSEATADKFDAGSSGGA